MQNGPAGLSNRPSSGSTINAYAYRATSLPANQYAEPSVIYVNTVDHSTSCRGNDIYDDVQAQCLSLVCKEPPYDNHIMVKALKKGELAKCQLNYSSKNHVQVSPTASMANIEDLYSKPSTTKKKTDDDGYDSNSSSCTALQEGEILLVENELYQSRTQPRT